MNERISNGGDCRTASATPGLLTMRLVFSLYMFDTFQKIEVTQN